MKSLKDLQNAFSSDKSSNENGSNHNYYAFWNMNVDEQAIIRFLPDKNTNNPYGFLVEKVQHRLDINGETKTVPCLTMYGQECPICKVSQAYYKANDEANGKKFWKKKTHIAQVYVVEDPIPADKGNCTGEVKHVTISYSLFKIIKDSIQEGDVDGVPHSYDEGTNFVIKKKDGKWPDYSRSKFDRDPSALDADTIDMIQDKLVDLQTLLPSNPGVEKIEAMLEAALNGTEYAPAKNAGSSTTDDDDDDESMLASVKAAVKKNAKSARVVEHDDDEDDDVVPVKAAKSAKAEPAAANPDDIIAQIRKRRLEEATNSTSTDE